MNAYELADELDKYLKGEEYDRLVWEAPTMLRQQADQIAELEKQDKPVAWSCWNEDMVDLPAIILFTEPDKYEWQSIKPLYRHSPQTKPLSDEEIQNIWYQHEKWLATVPLSFARAIEERHGIK